MNIPFLLKSINKIINDSKHRPSDQVIRSLIKSKFCSKDAEIIFGKFFSNTVVVYRFSKKIEPCFKIKETSLGRYICHLQLLFYDDCFSTYGVHDKIRHLNEYLDKLDYEGCSNFDFVDLTEIENIKF